MAATTWYTKLHIMQVTFFNGNFEINEDDDDICDGHDSCNRTV